MLGEPNPTVFTIARAVVFIPGKNAELPPANYVDCIISAPESSGVDARGSTFVDCIVMCAVGSFTWGRRP